MATKASQDNLVCVEDASTGAKLQEAKLGQFQMVKRHDALSLQAVVSSLSKFHFGLF